MTFIDQTTYFIVIYLFAILFCWISNRYTEGYPMIRIKVCKYKVMRPKVYKYKVMRLKVYKYKVMRLKLYKYKKYSSCNKILYKNMILN